MNCNVSKSSRSLSYRDLVRKTRPQGPPPKRAEGELDALLDRQASLERDRTNAADCAKPDPIDALRVHMVEELIPVFSELVEKYTKSGVSMRIDASKLLDGGREIIIDFAYGESRSRLTGTVTSEAIAFQETRQYAKLGGQVSSGPMLRLSQLTAQKFREFICARLAILLREAFAKR